MVNENLDQFLKELEIIRKEHQMLKDREEKFNIFSALHKDHDERRLHSRFISVLLQPKGTHGKGTTFLELFVPKIEWEKQLIIDDDIDVYPKEWDKKEYENIDILIINRKVKQCVIIENKIYAGDSNLTTGGQLFRYIEYAINEGIDEKDIFVIYLTLDGHDPSPESLKPGKDDERSVKKSHEDFSNLMSISYSELIIPWLEDCLKEVVSEPFLRESIIQYQKLLNKMSGNNTSREEKLAYKALVERDSQNMEAAKALYDNFKHIKWHAVDEFWNDLQKRISKDYALVKLYNKTISNKDNHVITALTHYETYRKGQKGKQKCVLSFKTEEGVLISVVFSANRKEQHFYFGAYKDGNDESKLDVVGKIMSEKFECYQQVPTMFLLKDFERDICFNDFHNTNTFALIDSKKKDKYVDEAFAEINKMVNDISNEYKAIH